MGKDRGDSSDLLVRFPCTGCGQCCRRVEGIMPTKEDGSCIYLADNECSIYEDRPFICNIDAIREKHYKEVSKEKFYEITAKSCNALMDEGGVDSKYRVDMGQFSATPHPAPQPPSQ